MKARNGWLADLTHCNIRNDFQALITNFICLHDKFCKEKNRICFLAIAETCENIMIILAKPSPPDETIVATLFNNLTTQIRLIQSKKEGMNQQDLFNSLNDEIIKLLTILPYTIQESIKKFKTEIPIKIDSIDDKTILDSSTKIIRQGLTTIWTDAQMALFINSMRDLPPDRTNLIKRMANKHPYLSGAGVMSLAAASGALSQTGINILLDMYKNTNTIAKESDLVPMVFTFIAMILLGSAYYKSRPIVRPFFQANDCQKEPADNENLQTRLLEKSTRVCP